MVSSSAGGGYGGAGAAVPQLLRLLSELVQRRLKWATPFK